MQLTEVKYAEMVGFLKGQRLAGKKIECKLCADYSTIRAEYERLMNGANEEVTEELPQHVGEFQATLPRFTDIKVLEFPSDNTVEVQIADEVRLLDVTWDDGTDSGITVKNEVAVVTDNGVERHVKICKLEVFNNGGVYKAFPLCKHGGEVEWLYPTQSTKYVRVKGYLSPTKGDWRWIEVDPTKTDTDTVVSASVTVCRVVNDKDLGITKRYPFNAVFSKFDGRWMVDSVHESNLHWISSVQDAIAYKYKIGEMVYLQSEYGSPQLAAFQITNVYYSKLLLMASLRCIMGNKAWHRNDTTVAPIVQLVIAKEVHK